jgi:23S rRNA (uracil747-C5)-methyltransferase
MYLRWVVRSEECVARIRELLPALQKQFPALVCVSANLQPIPHALLEGPEEIFLSDERAIAHQLGSLRLRLAPQAFVQTNLEVATKLYQTAAGWIGEARVKRVLELFCGQGAFSLFAAASAERILGIELNADAVAAANETARDLGLSHLQFKAADAAGVEEEFARFAPESVLVNPPRRGLGATVELLRRQQPGQLIYSSCSLESLARDLQALAGSYRLRRVQLFDLFPHTEHFEVLVWLKPESPGGAT